MDEIITEQADVRLHELYVPEDQAQHSDLLHISLCKALYELAALRSRLALLEEVAVEARIYLYGPSNGATGPLRAALDAAKEG